MPTATVDYPQTTTRSKKTVTIPRAEYEELRAIASAIEEGRVFTPTKAELRAVQESHERIDRGEYLTLEEFEHAMDDLGR